MNPIKLKLRLMKALCKYALMYLILIPFLFYMQSMKEKTNKCNDVSQVETQEESIDTGAQHPILNTPLYCTLSHPMGKWNKTTFGSTFIIVLLTLCICCCSFMKKISIQRTFASARLFVITMLFIYIAFVFYKDGCDGYNMTEGISWLPDMKIDCNRTYYIVLSIIPICVCCLQFTAFF